MSGKSKIVLLLGVVVLLYVALASGDDSVEVEVDTEE